MLLRIIIDFENSYTVSEGRIRMWILNGKEFQKIEKTGCDLITVFIIFICRLGEIMGISQNPSSSFFDELSFMVDREQTTLWLSQKNFSFRRLRLS